MNRIIMALVGLAIGLAATAPALAQGQMPQDNIIDGTLYPEGYTPVEIKNGKYPRVYSPNTEKLGPNEMRITALGTGMPNVITGAQKASGWFVELGNGEKFMFDIGSGTMENMNFSPLPSSTNQPEAFCAPVITFGMPVPSAVIRISLGPSFSVFGE